MRSPHPRFRLAAIKSVPFVLSALLAGAPHGAGAQSLNAATPLVQAAVSPTQLRFQPRIAYASATLRITGPEGFSFERAFGTGTPVFDVASAGARLADGQYRYQLTLGRVPSASLRAALEANAFGDDGAPGSPALAAEVDALRKSDSGSFLVRGGQIQAPQPMGSTTPVAGTSRGDIVPKDQVDARRPHCPGQRVRRSRLRQQRVVRVFDDHPQGKQYPDHVHRYVDLARIPGPQLAADRQRQRIGRPQQVLDRGLDREQRAVHGSRQRAEQQPVRRRAPARSGCAPRARCSTSI